MPPPHILIVDDEPNIVMSLEFLLRKNRYEVSIARNGGEALDAIARTAFDAVLLDIMMPDVDGYEVCRQLRLRPDRATTKVIFLSAKSSEADIAKGYAVGADLYVPKPFGTKQLMQQIKTLLAQEETVN